MVSKKATGSYSSVDLEWQREHIEDLRRKGFVYPLIAAQSFVRGMRESGYKSTATAIDEFIDNSIQAQADEVDIILGYSSENTTRKKIDQIAVVDNGHGMDPDMIRLAVIWGGTHREDDRKGFGRFGFGLPSAAVSISRRFTVFSKVQGGEWHAVRVDLDEIAGGAFLGKSGVVQAPEASRAPLPDFVRAAFGKADLVRGTVVLLDRLDKLTHGFVTALTFKEHFLHHVGLVYRDLLRSVRIRLVDVGETVEPRVVEPIDPLFLRPDARYYDENPEPEQPTLFAEALPGAVFEAKASDSGAAGSVRIRYSYMPPGFMGRAKRAKGRTRVRKENWGLVVLRAGRQIDVLRDFPETWRLAHQGSYDRNWAVEIDFDPTLDREFGVTTNKQQIVPSESMWDHLKENGVVAAIKGMKARHRTAMDADDGARDQKERKESEEIAAEAAKYRAKKPAAPPPDKERKILEILDREVARVAAETKRPPEEVKAEIESRPYKIEYESLKGAPFYRPEAVGAQKRIYLNTSHRFYSDVYNGPGITRRFKTSLELLLLVLAECEIEAADERETFYRMERTEWSRRLETAFELLDIRDPVADVKAAGAAADEEESFEASVSASA